MTDWRRRIVELIGVKQAIAELDSAKLWPWHLPSVKASEEKIAAVERTLGRALDGSYRSFLLHADGWRGFMQYSDLFGTDDHVSGPRRSRAMELLNYLEADGVLAAHSLSPADLVPIAVNSIDTDVMAFDGRSTHPWPVYWFAAGALVERYATFEDFYDAMVESNRRLRDSERARIGGSEN